MAERTDRTAAKQPLTPTLWILIVVVLIVLVGGGLYVVMSLLGDEPPIRVRNGSMLIELAGRIRNGKPTATPGPLPTARVQAHSR